MSLGDFTKCDLSAGLAKIDLEMLTKQIEIYYYSMLDKMRQKMSEVQYDNTSVDNRRNAIASMSSTGSTAITRLANNIAETSELLHTLYNTDNREIEIVRPESE